jgi:isopentenyl phosphate kinase
VVQLLFLKLGGSLITDKTRPYTARVDRLAGLAREIAGELSRNPELRLVLGHGSGSFGHTAAKEFGTRAGIDAARSEAAPGVEYWRGFSEVRLQAARLNQIVMEALQQAGLSSLALPPSAAVLARAGRVESWDLAPLRSALERGLLPVVYGDAVLDLAQGGTILSTEDLFVHLARELRPECVLLAGLEAGVWRDFPSRSGLIDKISPRSYAALQAGVGTAVGADVTGGMRSKVEQMLELAQECGVSAQIFSGEVEGNVAMALRGRVVGTRIAA